MAGRPGVVQGGSLITRTVALKGVERSATTAVAKLLSANFRDLNLYTGDKHGGTDSRLDDVEGFLVVHRNPYAWIDSMSREAGTSQPGFVFYHFCLRSWAESYRRWLSVQPGALYWSTDSLWTVGGQQRLVKAVEDRWGVERAEGRVRLLEGRADGHGPGAEYYLHGRYMESIDVKSVYDVLQRPRIRPIVEALGYDPSPDAYRP